MQLQAAFGERLGRFTQCSPRAGFALGLNAQSTMPEGRVVRIGNAAQTLHPVAGQGLNLGLRDAWQLVEALNRSLTSQALQDFYRTRQTDRDRTILLTDQMAKIFADPRAPQSLLGAGLGLIDCMTPAKQWLANQMMFGSR
jgi:2-octaprenyl-6-methoxyphenol hydroxylase